MPKKAGYAPVITPKRKNVKKKAGYTPVITPKRKVVVLPPPPKPLDV